MRNKSSVIKVKSKLNKSIKRKLNQSNFFYMNISKTSEAKNMNITIK